MIAPAFISAFIMAFVASITTEQSAPSLLSGYNTMSDEKKKNVNFKELVKIYQKVFYTIAALLTLIGILSYFFENENLWMALFILTVCWGLLPLFFLGKKYDTNTYKNWQKYLNYFIMCLLFFGGFLLSYFIYTTPLNEL